MELLKDIGSILFLFGIGALIITAIIGGILIVAGYLYGYIYENFKDIWDDIMDTKRNYILTLTWWLILVVVAYFTLIK